MCWQVKKSQLQKQPSVENIHWKNSERLYTKMQGVVLLACGFMNDSHIQFYKIMYHPDIL